MRRAAYVISAVGLAAAVVGTTAIPAAAYESVSLNTSWGWGRGTIWRDDGDSVGFRLYLTDQAADGHCVYFQVQGYRNNMLDSKWFRMTSDTCGKGTKRYYSGTKNIGGVAVVNYTGYRVKMCKNINNAPDVCSEASRIATKSLGSAG